MAYTALSILLDRLEWFSSPSICLILVSSEKLQSLTENLKFFKDFLGNSTGKCHDQEMIRSIEGKMSEVVYKVEDVVQEFAQGNACRSQNLLIDIFDEKCSIHHIMQQILEEIDSLKAEVMELGEKISAKEEDTVVNFDEGMRMIVERLLSTYSALEIASIIVGDSETARDFPLTYLAHELHVHPSVVSHFEIRLWVSVCEEESALQFIVIYSSEGGKTFFETHCIEEMAKILNKKLKSKRYLAVVRNYAASFQDFLDIQSWFPEDYNGSRVILANTRRGITTRRVQSHSSVDPLVKYEPLSLHDHFPQQNFTEAWEYLRDMVFADKSCPPVLITIGIQIAKNCQGVRRVLDEAARLLLETRLTPYKWKKVAKGIGYVFQIFLPDKKFYIFDDMLQSSEQVDSPVIEVERKKEKQNAVAGLEDSPMIDVEKEKQNAVVGLGDDLIKIKHQLTGESRHLEIITVVGMGGIGKTTLAKAVFDDPLIQYHFYVHAWVKVSQVYQLRDLLLGILHSIGHLDDDMYRMNTQELKGKLYRNLKGQRFLIVMDDLWNNQAWDDLRRCFPDDNVGSRILLTSRVKNLADKVHSNQPPHEMRFLDKDQSWQLLHSSLFLDNRSCPPELVEIGKKIAEKCQGLPLSIVVTAGVVSNMSLTCDSWEKVANSLDSLLNSDAEKCLKTLALSYNYLPPYLKACFLYMCAFPEDCEIDCQRLNRLWVAEGFVEAESGRNLEEVAEEYLEDLTNRSLVLVVKRSANGKIRTCQLHDLLRDLSLREAQKENFMQVMSRNIQVHSNGNAIQHRLSFHSGSCGNFQSDPTVQLNSFLCFDLGFDTIPDIGYVLLKFNFKFLRVLDINFLRFDNFPDLILNLIHLRFLALTAACELPSSISKLLNLQTLIVHGPWLSRKHGKCPTLPTEIWRMSQLRHLNLSAAIFFAHPLLDANDASSSMVLRDLQTLYTVRPTSCTKQVFQGVPNVKKLGIRQIREDMDPPSGSSDFLNNLVHLHQLETFKCSFYAQSRKTMYLTKWRVFPQRLKKLTLNGGYFPWTDMVTLGMLPNLEVLKLKNYAFQGTTWEADEDGFQSLKVLLIDKTDLVYWTANRYSFPRLETLVLSFCESLKEIPNDIVDDMQLIELHYCSSSAESSAGEIKEEQRSRDNDGLVVRIISKRCEIGQCEVLFCNEGSDDSTVHKGAGEQELTENPNCLTDPIIVHSLKLGMTDESNQKCKSRKRSRETDYTAQ